MKRSVTVSLLAIIMLVLIASCSNDSVSDTVTGIPTQTEVSEEPPASFFAIDPDDKYRMCVYEYWYSAMTNEFERGSTVPVDKLISYFMMFELQVRDPETRDTILNPAYEEYADDDKMIDFTIPVETVNGYLERKFDVKVDGSESQYLSDDGTDYNVYTMNRGQLYGELYDLTEHDGITTLYCRGWGFAGNGMKVTKHFELDVTETETGEIRYLECRNSGGYGFDA